MPLLGNIGSPKEVIVMWSGLLADIPKGWALCDGTNGTPNLLARFIVSVVSDAVEPGTTGGNDTVTLTVAQLPVHDHTVSESVHFHAFTPNLQGFTAGNGFNVGTDFGAGSSSTTSNETPGISITNTGSGSSIENRPLFFELAYIQQIT